MVRGDSGSVWSVNSRFPSPEEFEEFLRKMNASAGADAWAGLPASMAPLKAIFESLQGAMANSATAGERPIDWAQAKKTAAEMIPASETDRAEHEQTLKQAELIARSWVDAGTHFRTNGDQTDFISRGEWPALSLESLKLIAGPIAARSSADAMGNFEHLMPGQPEEFYQMVGSRLSGVTAHLQGVQLGHLLAALASGVLIGSEFSLTARQKPVLVVENVVEFATGSQGLVIDTAIYLAARELLTVALLDSNPWIRESLVTQVVRYANHLTFNSAGMQEIQQAIEGGDFESLGDLMGTMVNVEPSPEQTESMLAIQHLIACIMGWADFQVLRVCTHLANLAAIDEAYRRRRASSSPISKAFRLLLNIDFDTGLIRASADFWRYLAKLVPSKQLDDLWSHPDMMPTEQEIRDPERMKLRFSGLEEDEVDAALRRILDEDQP